MKINLIFPLFFVLLLSSISSFAQQADRPETVFELDLDEIGQRLLAAPDFSKKSAHASGPAIELAMPNGQMKTFRFFKTHPMHPASVAFTLNNVISWNNQDVTGTGTASSSYAFDGPISGFVPVTNYSLLQGQNPTGTGNLDGTNTANDPDFVTPLAPSGAPSTAGDFHLQSGSPALDVGTNTNFPADTYDVDDDSNTTEPTPDLDLNDRIANTTIDLGPYEGGGGSCTPPTMNFPTVNQPTCGIPTGTIAVNATGNGPLEYSVDDGANWQSSGTFTGLAPGSYNLKARLQSDPTYMASWMFNGGETLDFDGTDDHVVLPANLTASLTDFTFEAWVYWDGATNWQRIMDFGENTNVWMFLTPQAGGTNNPSFAITTSSSGGSQSINSSVAAAVGQWQHYAVVLDATANTGTLYIDGAQVGQNTNLTLSPSDLGNLSNNYLGRSQFSFDPYFDGKLDEVRIWDFAKTAAEVNCQKDVELLGTEPGLVAYYHFNQGTAGGNNAGVTTLDDLTTNNNDGTLTDFALTGTGSNWVEPGAPASGSVLFVNDDASGDNDGSSWANAFNDLQDAMATAAGCSNITQIWVAAGTYRPTSGTDRTISFVMQNDLAIYGGFAGTETMLSERDWVANVTTLSGDIGTPGDNTDNSYHVVANDNNGLNGTALLDGFTISGGNGNAIGSSPISFGGGMYNFVSSPMVTNCSFSGNSVFAGGGGMFNSSSSSPTVTNCSFSGNSASQGGGGMYNFISSPTVTNCSFSGNDSPNGGGMYNSGSSPSVTNCIFWGNSPEITNDNSNPTVTYSIVQGGYAGTGNLDVDPLFVSQPPIGLGTTGDLHLQACSPAKDAGTATGAPATDFDGDARPQGAGFDMGFDESTTSCCSPGNVAYVDTDATGANNGSSWADAFNNLQDALTTAAGCSSITQVWVAAGTYKPTSGTDRTISFAMQNDLAIYGGFAGTETMLSERDWVANVTTLSGDIGTPGDNTDNSYRVIVNTDLNNSALIDGFTISGGYADGFNGGGMLNQNSSPTITNCVFTNNLSGGGGAMANTNSSSPVITGCSFTGNTGQGNGGAVLNQSSSPNFSSCSFTGNSAIGRGGGVHALSGSPIFTNCVFSGNTAASPGGGLSLNASPSTVMNCSFSGNTANSGDGVFALNSSATITNSILWGNGNELGNSGSTYTVTYSIVQGGYAGTGNLDVDPLFVSQPPIGLGTTGDLHLQACSPAKDAGTATGAPATDFDGDARPQGAGFDMGFDENGDACSNCVAYAAMDTPVNIVDNTTITSTITVSETGTLDDVNVLNLNGTHTFTGDLTFTLTSPQGTSVVLIDGQCGGDDDFDLTLDDDAANPFACPINIGSTMQPQNPLSAFDGEDPAGDWVLSVADNAGDDQGTLQGWTLEICGDFTTGNCPPTLNVTGTIPSGTFQAQNSLTSDGTVPNGNTVELKAGSEVLLNANFEVSLGGILEVTIGACTP